MASAETFSGQSRDFTTDSTNANSTTSSTALTVQAVLSSHSLSSNPQAAALETVVSERNNLSAQNAQLWKLVEKQRSGYSQILKELERVRLERDIYKSRLETLGDDPEQVLKVLKKQFKERNKQSGLKASSSHSGLRTEEQKSLSDPKFGMIRTQSEAPGAFLA
jgi:RalA-binding protein 1